MKDHQEEERGMEHPLAKQYGLTANELLDAVNGHFRLKVALEGAVAEVQMEKKIKALVGSVVERFESYDQDGHPDFGIWLPGSNRRLLRRFADPPCARRRSTKRS
jgi:hypothetical protein